MDKLFNLLGLARASNRLAMGEQACLRALEQGKLSLLILAEDAGRSTRKRFLTRATEQGIPILQVGHKDEIGRSVGQTPKSVLGVLDVGLGKAMQRVVREPREANGPTTGPNDPELTKE